ncbi:hypothetical protein HFP51_03175 [Parasphingopyxis sp. CP4]|uniref:hypothetical protein n=1 Tax=Parasphingopyxis sp. CP4 TaxID=2724527 RepID=UPI0015A203C1|nr:hypothetical protein [Parasphingopyxis sp. CP4]QLC21274.1 hypothetical protein HFP51_03175 [Parasphingopyxis sp. CP4]
MMFGRLLLLVSMMMLAVPSQAQGPRTTPNVALPTPDPLTLSRILWGTMVSIHDANTSGNYSVLRDTGATNFQIQNSAAQLAETFRYLREQQIDLSNTLLLAPEFTQPPQMVAADVLRLQGVFGLRPVAIQFDIHYQWQANRWKVLAIGLQPLTLQNVQGG